MKPSPAKPLESYSTPICNYDGARDRFTQQDPIGLAGGMNLYGFAGGDPVNYSDPFGLCPDCIFDVIAIGFDIVDIARNGFSGGRGAALGADVLGALVPFVPSVAGVSLRAARGLDDLADAARAIDKGGELTRAGRSLEKHGSRAGSAFPRATGNAAAKNAAGQNVVEDILTSPGSRRVPLTGGRFKGGFDIYASDGRGVRYDAKGNFVGLLEPTRK